MNMGVDAVQALAFAESITAEVAESALTCLENDTSAPLVPDAVPAADRTAERRVFGLHSQRVWRSGL